MTRRLSMELCAGGMLLPVTGQQFEEIFFESGVVGKGGAVAHDDDDSEAGGEGSCVGA